VPIQTVIVDDEPLARIRLRSMLECDPEIHIAAECGNGSEALEAIQHLKPALIFLDIEMPERNGLDVLSSLQWKPVSIFVTAHRNYAVSAFEACAFDYLLKPFTQARFASVLARAKQQIAAQSDHALAQENNVHQSAVGATTDLLVVKAAGKLVFVRTAELRWIEAEKDYVRLHLNRGSYFIRETMTNLQKRLDPNAFIRIHRSTIVNIHEISEVTSLTGSDCSVMLRDGTELTMSRRYRSALDRLLGCESPISKPALQGGSADGDCEFNIQVA
jgi:two-component system LytT family response regulator